MTSQSINQQQVFGKRYAYSLKTGVVDFTELRNSRDKLLSKHQRNYVTRVSTTLSSRDISGVPFF